MRLQDLTKAELIAIIRKLEENSICERYVQSVLIDAQKKSEYAAIKESEKAYTEYLSILNEYHELLKPFRGGKIADITQETQDKLTDIMRRLNAAEKKMHDAVRGDHFDLAVPTHSEALELGVKYATVYWYEEGQ